MRRKMAGERGCFLLSDQLRGARKMGIGQRGKKLAGDFSGKSNSLM